MSVFRTYIFTILTVFLPLQLFSQHTADSLQTLIKTADGFRKGELNLELANHFLSENTDSAIHYAHIAATIGKKTNNHVVVIRSFAIIGEAYQKNNQIKEALSFYFSGLKLAEKYNEKSLSGTIYNGIGVCYFAQSNPTKAAQYLKLAAEAKKAANDYQYYALISANLAVLQIMNKSFPESIKTLKEVEKTLLQKKQTEYLPTIYNSLGAAYQTINPDSCVYFYNKGFELSSKNKDYLNMMTTCQNIGDYYLEQKNYPKAIEYMKKAISINELRPEDPYKPALFERMSTLYESIGDFKNAYDYKKRENEVRQKLFAATKEKEIAELEIKYQTAKKETEIQQGRQQIEKAKNQQNLLLFGGISLFLIAGSIAYFIFQKRKITQKFEQEKLRLFENILHDIRTPLTLIDGPIQVMKQNSGSANLEQLALMERNSKKLINLVNELLDTSKIGKGSFQLQHTTGNIGDFIEEIANGFSNEAKSKDIQIISNKIPEGKYVSFPSNAIEKILTNLIGNAVKYCPPKSEIHVKSQIIANKLVVEIVDNGPGIPKNEQKKVFQRFFRGKEVSNDGIGIGLSIVKDLVDLAQGTIELQSSSTGTTFTVTIPVKEVRNTIETVVQSEDIPVLLLVEDDADMAAFTINVLQENFNVLHAKNGLQAINLIRENLPDIVLSDVMMPEKDGVELLQEIRSDELTNHLPVVLFSAKSSLESRLKGLQHGADAYISKPFSPEELKLTVQNLFTTVQRNKEIYQEAIDSEQTFEERIKSPNAYVNKVIGQIINNIDNPEFSVNELADNMLVSRSQLHRKLTSLTGFSTTSFISLIRLEKAKDLLQNGEGNITEIAYKCGFSSQSYFTKSFTEYFQKTPSQFIKSQ